MKHDAALDEEVPQIRTGKRVGEHLHVAHLLPLPADTPFGNLAGKYIDIVVRLDHVNVLVARVFSSYESAKAQNDGRIREHALLAEELVYWLRKTADELIALIHVLAVRQSTGAYPTRVETDCIGRLLGDKNPPAWVVPHLEFLRLLNDISNAYKHSFVNSELMLVGRDEPGVYALDRHEASTINVVGSLKAFLRTAVLMFNPLVRGTSPSFRATLCSRLASALRPRRRRP